MSHTMGLSGDPFIAASAIAQWAPVRFASGVAERVMMATNADQYVVGVAIATAASPGDPVAIQRWERGKAIAGASIAAGRPVAPAPGSIGLVIEFVASPATAANPMRGVLGYAMQNAGAGDVFTVQISPHLSL